MELITERYADKIVTFLGRKRGYDLLSKSCGLSVGRAVGVLAAEGNLTVAQLHAFFDKIVRLGFVVAEPACSCFQSRIHSSSPRSF